VNYEFKPSFDRSFKKLEPSAKKKVADALSSLIDFFESGQRPSGLGLKHLRGDFWEIRIGLKIRVLFIFEGSTIGFVIVGSHNDIRRFLRNL
jgi:mRNA-degrading endonuclease RelE of RelBE toxin-antitoxin system